MIRKLTLDAAVVHRPNSCGPGKHNATDLDLRFKTSHACQVGMVHSAFWEGTENKYGGIKCVNKDDLDTNGKKLLE